MKLATLRRINELEELIEDIPHPAPVPTTAIYSKQDGIVPWQLCMEQEETFLHQNIQMK